jgi:hypothetical protein
MFILHDSGLIDTIVPQDEDDSLKCILLMQEGVKLYGNMRTVGQYVHVPLQSCPSTTENNTASLDLTNIDFNSIHFYNVFTRTLPMGHYTMKEIYSNIQEETSTKTIFTNMLRTSEPEHILAMLTTTGINIPKVFTVSDSNWEFYSGAMKWPFNVFDLTLKYKKGRWGGEFKMRKEQVEDIEKKEMNRFNQTGAIFHIHVDNHEM